jgi:hypothetical protein
MIKGQELGLSADIYGDLLSRMPRVLAFKRFGNIPFLTPTPSCGTAQSEKLLKLKIVLGYLRASTST